LWCSSRCALSDARPTENKILLGQGFALVIERTPDKLEHFPLAAIFFAGRLRYPMS